MQSAQTASSLLSQYSRLKAEHPGCIIMFRLGSIFAMFQKDAYVAHKLLDLKVIRKNLGSGDLPACGVHKDVASAYAKRLAEYGYTVAICDEVGNTVEDSDVISRAVVGVMRPENESEVLSGEEGYRDFLTSFETKGKPHKKEENEPKVCEIDHELRELNMAKISPENAWNLLKYLKQMYYS